MQSKSKPMPSKEMHRYVLLMLGVFVLFTISFPIAFFRVSKEKKFAEYNSHLKSLTVEGNSIKPSSATPTK
ncbi:MAG: hypothetical protein KME64_28955 [Scytonematopsis contorta HA4267-MV1]|jgi:hypothetical protein|nr:hypothetical protein [Scytonematopsis contorta HA4267-MV1]